MEEIKQPGHLHPMTQMIHQATRALERLGFSVALGPEIETEYYNFDALNVPADHPARDMQDTFWLTADNKDGRRLLRTHTTAVDVHYMEKNKPPLAAVSIGRVFRNEATDATHEAQFFQLDGLMVGRDISMANLKAVLEKFFQELFGLELKIRLRPSYFPFVEPGAELDVSCFRCAGKGCPLCKQTGWIEILGTGMLHPNVLQAVQLDPEVWSGFAFGVGLDRLVMLKHGIGDIRWLCSGDWRFIKQF
ncbi:MAG: phenylalanine--tRNA ligase subunit alpha [Patescibacteria group bacterium]|nr:phenylalanine--tRNA ligase subunit alpha [Patescibacteria group bacterium]